MIWRQTMPYAKNARRGLHGLCRALASIPFTNSTVGAEILTQIVLANSLPGVWYDEGPAAQERPRP